MRKKALSGRLVTGGFGFQHPGWRKKKKGSKSGKRSNCSHDVGRKFLLACVTSDVRSFLGGGFWGWVCVLFEVWRFFLLCDKGGAKRQTQNVWECRNLASKVWGKKTWLRGGRKANETENRGGGVSGEPARGEVKFAKKK